MIPNMFPDNPGLQQLAQQMWDREEYAQVEDMVAKERSLADPRRQIRHLDNLNLDIAKELRAMEEMLPTDRDDTRYADLKRQIVENVQEQQQMRAQIEVMETPALRNDIFSIDEVPPADLQAIQQAVEQDLYTDAGRPVPDKADPEYTMHVIQNLRLAGYNIQIVAPSNQAVTPTPGVAPLQKQAPRPHDPAGRAASMDRRNRVEGDFNRDGLIGPPPVPQAPSRSAEIARGAVQNVSAYMRGQTAFQKRNVDAVRPALDWLRDTREETEAFWFGREGKPAQHYRYIFGRD
jgi:hypothetical protein